MEPNRRDGVSGGGTQRKSVKLTGETLFGPAEESPHGREAHKGETRKRSNDAGQGIGGGHSTEELRENRREGRAATFIKRTKQGKAAGLRPQGNAPSRPNRAKRKAPARLDNARKLQRTLYRVAKQQPERRFTLLYDKVCRQDILREAWQRVKSNKGAAGVDQVDIGTIRDYGEERFLGEVEQELRSRQYRTALVRRVHIPKPGQPGKTRPLGIPTVKDRVVQMAVKIVIEPLFEADFMPCSFGFRPKRTPRMALSAIVQSVNEGYSFVVDVDLKSYFDTISHELLLELVERRVGDTQVLRLIRAWLKAGVMEEGKVTHPDRGSPQGGVISPTLSNIFLHEVDRQWCRSDGVAVGDVRLVRYADDMVLLARTGQQARKDAQLYFPPESSSAPASPHRGRPRHYGAPAPTPEQIRTEEARTWSTIDISVSGAPHSMRIKRLGPVLWRTAGLGQVLQLVVIAPLRYRLRKHSKLLYRRPAFLICTDAEMDARLLVQAYVQRWDIETNFREEKTLLGVGQAQVRNGHSVEAVPALQVLSYAMLLLASLRAVRGGGDRKADLLPVPKWNAHAAQSRFSTVRAIQQLRAELWGKALGLTNFSGFVAQPAPTTNPEKFLPHLPSAVLYAAN